MLAKPDRVFDRTFEWAQLAAFAARDTSSGTQLGVVSGRRRQGKTFLLEALSTETGGFYFGATQAAESESLYLFAQAIAARFDVPVVPRFASWDEAMTYLFAVHTGGPVVLDEFPYLSKVSPQLPSIIQREVDRTMSAGGGIPLLLCGSAMSVMGGLLSGSAPLRGRAGLELIIRPFDYPLAAKFWGINDPRLAIMQHAVIGGTPAYRRFVNGDVPADLADFDDWIKRAVLNPASPLLREARYLLEEEADLRDTALYNSVLAAVASGNNSRGGIASYVGRKANEIGHHLNVLEDCALLRKEPDVFHANRSTYRIAEPLVTFYQVVMRPQWGLLESGRAAHVWRDAVPRFQAQVLGPHFEQMCREFAILADDLFGGLPGEVGSGLVTDPAAKEQIQIDVVVLAPAVPGEPRRILSLGEAKWGKAMGRRHLARLRRARDLLAQRGYDTGDTVLACYSGGGFEADLLGVLQEHRAAAIGPDRLYDRVVGS